MLAGMITQQSSKLYFPTESTSTRPELGFRRSNAYAKSIIDREHAETLRLAKEEQKALEAAISKSQKKLKEATPAIGS
eukprot:g14631.t3